MSKSIVFVLHGVGNYSENWMEGSHGAVHGLRTAAKGYEFFENHSLDTYVEFVPILYDDIFQRFLEDWTSQASVLKGIPASAGYLPVFEKFKKEVDDKAWWATTALDAALYSWFRPIQQRVVLRVLSQVTTRIANAMQEPLEHSFHVLAHSLGTAVAHDALHHLGTETWLKARTNDLFDQSSDLAANDNAVESLATLAGTSEPFHPRRFSFESVTMLSNVTPRLAMAEDPYASIVRPGSARDDNAYTRTYINVDHNYDPISLFGGFEMPLAWSPGGVNLGLKHFQGNAEEIHDASHYVAHPFVHLRLLNLYVDPFSVTKRHEAVAKKFDQQKTLHKQRPLVEDLTDILAQLSQRL